MTETGYLTSPGRSTTDRPAYAIDDARRAAAAIAARTAATQAGVYSSQATDRSRAAADNLRQRRQEVRATRDRLATIRRATDDRLASSAARLDGQPPRRPSTHHGVGEPEGDA
jgi:transposase